MNNLGILITLWPWQNQGVGAQRPLGAVVNPSPQLQEPPSASRIAASGPHWEAQCLMKRPKPCADKAATVSTPKAQKDLQKPGALARHSIV